MDVSTQVAAFARSSGGVPTAANRVGASTRCLLAIACFGLVSALAGQATAQVDDHSQGFAPLARARIAIQTGQTNQLLDVLRSFASAENLRVQEGQVKRGMPPEDLHAVSQIKLSLDDGTFYYASNFYSPRRFELTAYSHAAQQSWQPTWLRLVAKLKSAFGSTNVKPDQGDSSRVNR